MMRVSVRIALTFGVLLMLGLPHQGFGQIDRGSIVGTVKDSTGAVVPGARVTATNLGTNESTSLTTAADGSYTFTVLRIGNYQVSAEKHGFKRVVQTNVTVGINQSILVDLTLAVGDITQVVEVTAAPPLVQSETSSLGTIETQQRIVDLPLNGRDFIQLAYLGPGANSGMAGAQASGGVPENERANEALSVNGLRVSDNNFLLDGVDNNEWGLGGIIVLPPPDAIQEFRTEENSMNAEFGRGGAAVNVVLKSGSNKLHGTVYEFLRNDKLDAGNYFASSKPELRQNQFGFSLGGPIQKEKTFVFGDLQLLRNRKGLTYVSTVPSEAEKSGDFRELLTGTTFSPCPNPSSGDPAFDTGAIFDPTTVQNYSCSDGTVVPLRSQFSSNGVANVIPLGSLNTVGMKAAQLYPTATVPGQAFSNYVYTGEQVNDQYHFDIRVDRRLGAQDQLFAHYSFDHVSNFRPADLGSAGGNANGFAGNVKDGGQSSALGWTHSINSTMVNDLHGGYFRYSVSAFPPDAGQNRAKALGIPNANLGDENTSGLTQMTVGGYQSLGDTLWFPELVAENIYQIADTVSVVRGRHTIKFGVDFRRQQRNFFQDMAPTGYMEFTGALTDDITGSTGGSGLADLLIGASAATYRDGFEGREATRYWDLAEFAQDDIRVSPKLTLNLGLRYEVHSPANGQVSNPDLATGQLIQSFGSGAKSHAGLKFDLSNWGPRLGFAYTPSDDKKTVVRGAFGIFYAPEANTFDDLGVNPPLYQSFSRYFNTASAPVPGEYQLISEGFPVLDFTSTELSGQLRYGGLRHTIPTVYEWNLTLQCQLAENLVLTAGYVGTRGYHLWNHESGNFDQPQYPLDSNFSDSTGNYGRPYFNLWPEVSTILPEDYPMLSMNYHSFQTSVNKQFSHGFNLLASYTLSKNVGTADGNVATNIQNIFNLAAEKGPVDPDIRHLFSLSYIWELPVGRGHHFLNHANRWVEGALGGWRVAGITALRSGMVFTPVLSFDPTNTGVTARPDRIHDPYDFSYDTATQSSLGCTPGKQTLDCYYNQAAFTIPALAPGQSSAHEFGNAGRNILRGPSQTNFDFSLVKEFPVRESMKIQFRGELFNVLNTPQFGLPSTNPDVPGGAAITSTINDNREIQLALKVIF